MAFFQAIVEWGIHMLDCSGGGVVAAACGSRRRKEQ